MKVTFTHLSIAVAIAIFMSGAGYSVGRVHAKVDEHEKSDGHPATTKKVQEHEVLLARITVVLEHLEKRSP